MPLEIPDGGNLILGQSHFIKTVEDIYEAIVNTVPQMKFGVAFNEENVQFTPELYDPKTNTFRQMQKNNMIRVYHSVSILVPDGRVLTGGGGLCGNCSANHYDAQLYTPPYLLTESGA